MFSWNSKTKDFNFGLKKSSNKQSECVYENQVLYSIYLYIFNILIYLYIWFFKVFIYIN